MINLNLRSLRKDGEKFTVSPKSVLEKQRHLCSHCAYSSDCKHAKRSAEARQELIESRVLECGGYSTPIGFSNLTGLDSESFNTLRLGSAWAKRVQDGQEIGLVCTKTGELVGRKKVVRVVVGPKDRIINDHAYKNHLMLGMKRGAAAKKMAKVLPGIYGNLIYKNNKMMTAIYLSDYELED